MTHSEHPYLIVGGGMAADAAIRALHEQNPDAAVTLISAESTLPYDRPPLSKWLITDPNTTVSDLYHDPAPYSEQVKTFLGRRAVRIDRENHQVLDDRGERHAYRKLLLVTGGTPKTLPNNPPGVKYYRRLRDFTDLEEHIALVQQIAVVGSGFIGCEIAASLSKTKCNIFMIFPESRLGAERFPEGLSLHLEARYRERGIDLLPEQQVTGVERSGEYLIVTTDGGGRYAADHVVAGLGIRPNVELAEDAGLEVNDGIRVNAQLQTSDPDIYAAGDNASAYRKELDRFERVEHEQNAVQMGKAAGKSMSGSGEVSFDYTPLFYSDLLDMGYEAVGDLDANLTLVEDWHRGYEQGVVYYLDKDHLRGVLLWNLFGKTGEARELLVSDRTFQPDDLIGAITA